MTYVLGSTPRDQEEEYMHRAHTSRKWFVLSLEISISCATHLFPKQKQYGRFHFVNDVYYLSEYMICFSIGVYLLKWNWIHGNAAVGWLVVALVEQCLLFRCCLLSC